MEVTIFDNLNTFIEQVVFIIKNIGHCLQQVPDLIGNSLVTLSDLVSYCPPFISLVVLFMAGSGIILKGTHWGS